MESGGGKLAIAIGAAGLAASSVWAVNHRIDSLVSDMSLLCEHAPVEWFAFSAGKIAYSPAPS